MEPPGTEIKNKKQETEQETDPEQGAEHNITNQWTDQRWRDPDGKGASLYMYNQRTDDI